LIALFRLRRRFSYPKLDRLEGLGRSSAQKEIIPMEQRKHLDELHAKFLAILPRIELHGRIYVRHLSADRKADAIQEMQALAWKWFLRLDEKGKDPADFLMSFTTFLARAVNSGRRLVGMAKSKDVMNPIAQRQQGFKVESLPSFTRTSYDHLYSSPKGQELRDYFEERLWDNTITPVLDQVQFRIDFPAWLETLTGRERRMIRGMARNERTLDLSKQFDLSPARISQMRRELQLDWKRFIGEAGTSIV
jgi:hypothetical protein